MVEISVTVSGGKYTVVYGGGRGMRALRYGDEWRDLTGDGLVMALAQEILDLRDTVAKLEGRPPDIEVRR